MQVGDIVHVEAAKGVWAVFLSGDAVRRGMESYVVVEGIVGQIVNS